MKPDTYTTGLGELIRAHRLYLGLSQRDMAAKLDKDRRDYQRIEQGRDACPPGLLGRIEALTDQFDDQVETVLEVARRDGGVNIAIPADDRDGQWTWERNVAGRAALLATAESDGPPITFTIVPAERSA
ncbi:HTH DNA binding protein [Mycobacterium phage Saguaro]|uniref:Helix-turn-helix DNA-binding domain protein n=1 Tax=Mycobacterium phage Saguaro TaxID=2315616 RepID=A0A386K9H3_9CAUD|nr:HTH DNA binding protein [Mycobacterium phage Saguaro]AYD82041.1 helix-turn-helix DNA-binding domain protein [Mycobacterium phage Saguaro]